MTSTPDDLSRQLTPGQGGSDAQRRDKLSGIGLPVADDDSPSTVCEDGGQEGGMMRVERNRSALIQSPAQNSHKTSLDPSRGYQIGSNLARINNPSAPTKPHGRPATLLTALSSFILSQEPRPGPTDLEFSIPKVSKIAPGLRTYAPARLQNRSRNLLTLDAQRFIRDSGRGVDQKTFAACAEAAARCGRFRREQAEFKKSEVAYKLQQNHLERQRANFEQQYSRSLAQVAADTEAAFRAQMDQHDDFTDTGELVKKFQRTSVAQDEEKAGIAAKRKSGEDALIETLNNLERERKRHKTELAMLKKDNDVSEKLLDASIMNDPRLAYRLGMSAGALGSRLSNFDAEPDLMITNDEDFLKAVEARYSPTEPDFGITNGDEHHEVDKCQQTRKLHPSISDRDDNVVSHETRVVADQPIVSTESSAAQDMADDEATSKHPNASAKTTGDGQRPVLQDDLASSHVLSSDLDPNISPKPTSFDRPGITPVKRREFIRRLSGAPMGCQQHLSPFIESEDGTNDSSVVRNQEGSSEPSPCIGRGYGLGKGGVGVGGGRGQGNQDAGSEMGRGTTRGDHATRGRGRPPGRD